MRSLLLRIMPLVLAETSIAAQHREVSRVFNNAATHITTRCRTNRLRGDALNRFVRPSLDDRFEYLELRL